MKRFTFLFLLAFISMNSLIAETPDSIPAAVTSDSIPAAETTDSLPIPRIAGPFAADTTEKPDSCYVFAELRWDPGLFSYSAKIIYTDFMEDIRDENGQKLKFKGFIRAVNYMSIQGWEVMQIYPYHYDDKEREEIAILRKYVPLEEALSVSQPRKK